MECTKIKQLLPAYADGVLNEQKKAIVEGHLAKCKFCSEELASLKAYVKQRIKIPLGVAAVAATVVLAIFVFKVLQPAKPKEQPIKIAHKEKVAETTPFLEAGPAVVPEELAVPAPAEEEKPAEELAAPMPIEEKSIDELTEPISVPIEEEKPIELALLVEPEGLEGKTAPFTQRVRLTDVLTMIKNLTSILKGEVISVEYKEKTKIPQYITAKIPSKNYKTFLQKLALYGSVENPPEGAVPLTEEAVSIKIKLAW